MNSRRRNKATWGPSDRLESNDFALTQECIAEPMGLVIFLLAQPFDWQLDRVREMVDRRVGDVIRADRAGFPS